MLRTHFHQAAPTQYGGRIAGSDRPLNCWLASLSNAAAKVGVWLRRSRTRREITDHELSDIGVSRGQARYESERRFWEP
jgi:uncharacterized protein YjiS (DUF1127 family)